MMKFSLLLFFLMIGKYKILKENDLFPIVDVISRYHFFQTFVSDKKHRSVDSAQKASRVVWKIHRERSSGSIEPGDKRLWQFS